MKHHLGIGTTAVLARLGITPYRVAEDSMAPALRPDDGLLTMRLHRPRRGTIVVLEHPERPGFILVKRIVGLPGETVAIEDGQVLIDNAPLTEPWAQGHSGRNGRWDVSTSSMFVASDARELTRSDSRSFGPLPIAGTRRVIHVVHRGKTSAVPT
ncbi:MAG: signal peptidase I [Candidatus Microthrix parvicella]|uniref:Signal peptidase I n=1 Tax=Candidatus Neomicrothrix parvicella RN1 TaxID=1229780 RepID=R4Z798_9ACTN|nr:signal peptidase I [Candidatus Microthrix parvicella]NLH67905.1 signal peptidase I [Candidatus Microthrix parvicella]CCM66031.1 hypothetical protein BN381_90102 [Candidatus Microthrix parvicella RN1]